MLQADAIRAALDDIVAAALLAEGWNAALERFARAAGARDAVLMFNAPGRMIAAVTSEGVADAVADFAAGRTPPNSRYIRVNTLAAKGFRIDHDDYTDEELARDPFYQEFLRSNGVFWHANAALARNGAGYIELSLKRRIELGPYSRADAAVLDSVLPELHAAARIAKCTLDAEARGMTWVLQRRGALVLELDGQGRVPVGAIMDEANPSHPLRLCGRRLVAADAACQAAIDRAIATATAKPQRMALAPISGLDGRRWLLQVHPVPGVARDVFLSAIALAVLIERDRRSIAIDCDIPALRDAFGLTGKEAAVASLIAEGLDIFAVAKRLRIQPDTARTYLKDAFEKTGTRRQAELVALLARIGAASQPPHHETA